MPANEPFGIQRGDFRPSFFTKGIFIIGRLISGPAQYAIIQAHPLARFGVPRPPSGGVINVFGHSYPRLPFLTAFMPFALALKHTLWLTGTNNERVAPGFAVFALISDFLYEATTTLVFTAAASNPAFSERQFYIGLSLFFTGLTIEVVAELHRAAFKSKPENKGKLCTTGFWAVTRHINYTANVIYGFGVGLATGGIPYSMATAGMYLTNFTTNAIPSHEDYMKEKYGRQWAEYEKKVPWKLIPYLY